MSETNNRPAVVGQVDRELGPLPEPAYRTNFGAGLLAYSADQMRAYAAQQVAAERERCVRILEAYRVPVGNSAAGEMAAEWTIDALREIRAAIRGA